MKRNFLLKGFAFASAIFAVSVAPVAQAQNVTGAGSTFVALMMKKWMAVYNSQNPGVKTDYQSVGSGAGIAQYKAGTVTFGASDAPMNDTELNGAPPTLQFPVVAGAVVLAYNVPGVGPGLKLSGDTIANIYLKQITAWNDPKIKKDNPSANLPATPIFVAHRADGSGTTFIFTDYLSSVSPAWKSGPGKGKSVGWPVGIGGNGNAGVATLVRTQPGAIGYVELAYAVSNKLSFGLVKNKAGVFVEPSIESATADIDAVTAKLKNDIRTSTVDQAGKNSYPITGVTYVLMSKAPKDKVASRAMVTFMRWVLGPGQALAPSLNYAPLPKSLTSLYLKSLDQVNNK